MTNCSTCKRPVLAIGGVEPDMAKLKRVHDGTDPQINALQAARLMYCGVSEEGKAALAVYCTCGSADRVHEDLDADTIAVALLDRVRSLETEVFGATAEVRAVFPDDGRVHPMPAGAQVPRLNPRLWDRVRNQYQGQIENIRERAREAERRVDALERRTVRGFLSRVRQMAEWRHLGAAAYRATAVLATLERRFAGATATPRATDDLGNLGSLG